MSWAITATVGVAAYGAVSQYSQQAGAAAFSAEQAAWNNKQNRKSARAKGMALDTNVVRTRTEAAATMQGIDSSVNEGLAQARVNAAAMGMGEGSYDTVLNTFAKKQNQAQGATMQELIAAMVTDKLQREDVGVSATAGQSVANVGAPSAFGAILGGAANYFQTTYGLKGALPSFGGTTPSSYGGASTGLSLAGYDPFAGIGQI